MVLDILRGRGYRGALRHRDHVLHSLYALTTGFLDGAGESCRYCLHEVRCSWGQQQVRSSAGNVLMDVSLHGRVQCGYGSTLVVKLLTIITPSYGFSLSRRPGSSGPCEAVMVEAVPERDIRTRKSSRQ